MTEPDKTAGVRKLAQQAVGNYLTEDQYATLFDAIMAIEKSAWGNCATCKKRIQVQIPDAKAVVSALTDLVTKIADIPKEQVQEQDRIVFERVVYMSPEETEDD